MSTMQVEETAPSNEELEQKLADDSSSEEKKAGCCHKTKEFFLYESSNKEIQAFYFNQFGRSVLFISFMFLSLAVLQLANEQAGCPQNENGSYENCGNQVYGMDPSSMLALMAVVGGIATSIFMPYAGAVVDFSDHRLAFGRVCAFLLTLTNFVQIFIFPSTWFPIVILQSVVASATFMANSMVMWSYTSDIGANDHDLHGITSSGRMWETIGMLGFFIVIGAINVGAQPDSVVLARISQGVATFVGGISLFFAYKRYKPVKAVKTLESGRNMYLAGFGEIWSTGKTLRKTDPTASRYLFASVFVEAGIGSITSMAITYLSEQIQMSSTQIIIFILINFLTNPIGVLGHRTLARKIGHKRNYLLCVSYIMTVMSILIATIYKPEQSNIVFIFSLLIGIGYGWYYPSSNGYFVSLVPSEKVVELWGFNAFCSAILSWAPPLYFGILNESTGNLRLGLLGVIIFLAIGVLIGFTIPEHNNVDESDEKAVEVVKSGSDVEKGEDVTSEQSTPVE